VIVKKCSMGAVTRIVQAIRFCLFSKSAISIINKELILLRFTICITRVTHIDIQPAISVYIGHTYPSAPGLAAAYSCFICYVLKLQISLVEIKPVLLLIRRKVD